MFTRYAAAAVAIALMAAAPTLPAFARGGGGGGDFGGGGGAGGGGSSRGASDRGGFGYDAPRTASQQNLFDQARRECNGPKYPSGASPRVNYDANSFTCFETGTSRH